jgi:hypothetical protein
MEPHELKVILQIESQLQANRGTGHPRTMAFLILTLTVQISIYL